MKKCEQCGLNIDDDLTRCPYCGAEVLVHEDIPTAEVIDEAKISEEKETPFYYEQPEIVPANVKVSGWWFVAGLFIPVLGIIFAIIFGRTNLAIRRRCLKGVIFGIILSIVLDILSYVLIFVLYQQGVINPEIAELFFLFGIGVIK